MAQSGLRDRWSDGDLLAAIAAGDGIAFDAFYARYLPVVVAYLVRETRDREAAADLAAEVFAAVLLASGRYRDDGGPAVGWVVGIARNKLRVSRRRGRIESRARERLGFAPVVLADADLERVERLADAGRALALIDSLPEHERDAVRRRVLEEQGYEQIARELRCSELVIRKRVSRGLARLRERLEEQ
ncbi:MAG: RNA polymerase sigma factor [Solirubrobacteraceae bacterium]